jgi:cyclophilin family peptidyl-prolyl cis-trans isomerase
MIDASSPSRGITVRRTTMLKSLLRGLIVLGGLLTLGPSSADDNPRVTLIFGTGKVVIELFQTQSPMTVENFLTYVRDKFYDGTVFHRVIPEFMIQGGGFEHGMVKKEPRDPIKNESNNALSNERGTLAMARTNEPHSATSQFFINVVDNDFLDYGGQGENQWGYAVFGKVVEGMDVIDLMTEVETTTVGPYKDVPEPSIAIQSARLETNEE